MPELEEPLCSLLQTILTLLQSITAHASGASQPNAKPIHTIRDMACGGSCSPMWSVHPLSRNGLSNTPTVGKSQRKFPYIQDITHQDVPIRTNPERPGDVTLAHVSTCPYRQLTDNSQSHSQSHSQTALNPAASILARMKEDATSPNPQSSTCNQAKSPNRSTRNCLS